MSGAVLLSASLDVGEIAEFQDAALVREPYALGSMQIFRACQERELLLVKRNMPLYVIRFMMLFVLALVTATLFIRTRMAPTSIADGNLYFGGKSSRLHVLASST